MPYSEILFPKNGTQALKHVAVLCYIRFLANLCAFVGYYNYFKNDVLSI